MISRPSGRSDILTDLKYVTQERNLYKSKTIMSDENKQYLESKRLVRSLKS